MGSGVKMRYRRQKHKVSEDKNVPFTLFYIDPFQNKFNV